MLLLATLKRAAATADGGGLHGVVPDGCGAVEVVDYGTRSSGGLLSALARESASAPTSQAVVAREDVSGRT